MIYQIVDGKKYCRICKNTKPIEEMVKATCYKDGVSTICKECKRKHFYSNRNEILKRRKEYLQKNGDKIRKQNVEYRRRTKNSVLMSNAKRRAKIKDLDFNLTIEDIVIPEFCPVLGIKIDTDNNKLNPSSPTVDRIDNTKGYVKGNVRVISWRANFIKSDSTIDEMEKVLQYMKGNIK